MAADSYIGSIVGLVSKSEIRYEGVVVKINTRDSTIGLKNVKSFGTEGRKTDGPQVPPNDKIYEYILFRGSDIKDLQVKATPPVEASPPALDDPAIIELHCSQTTVPSTSSPISGSGFYEVTNGLLPQHQPIPNPRMNVSSSSVGPSNLTAPYLLSSSPPFTLSSHSSLLLEKSSTLNNVAPIPLNTVPNVESTPLVTPNQLLQSGMNRDKASSLVSLESAQKDVEVIKVSPSQVKKQPPLLPLPSPAVQKTNRSSSNTYQDNGRGYVRGSGRRRGRRIGSFHQTTIFTKDFDFEAMNEKFNKDEVWGHLGKSNETPDDEKGVQDGKEEKPSESEANPVYVKDEFFDSLSCDSLDRASDNGKTRFSERMKLDAETFGDVSRYGGGRGVLGPTRGGYWRGGYSPRGAYHPMRTNGYARRGRDRRTYNTP